MFLACSLNFGKSQPQRSYKKGSYKKKSVYDLSCIHLQMMLTLKNLSFPYLLMMCTYLLVSTTVGSSIRLDVYFHTTQGDNKEYIYTHIMNLSQRNFSNSSCYLFLN